MNIVRTVVSAKNPKWANYAKTIIDIEVNFKEIDEEFVPFTASLNDSDENGRNLFAQAKEGKFGAIESFVPPADITGETAIAMLREYRNYLLQTVVDPVVSNPLRWAELSNEKQSEYSNYRKALLNITTDYPNVRKTFDSNTRLMVFADVEFPVQPV